MCGFSRSKYYPEYHTNKDDFKVVTEKGLQDSFVIIKTIIDAFELGLYPQTRVLCEPNLGKRNLYPQISKKENYKDIVDEFINNWENTQEGVNVNVRKFVEHRGAMYHKKYDLNKLAKEDSYIESMLGPAMGRNPYVQYKLKEAGAEYLKTSTIESGSGTQNIIVKKPNNGQRRGSNDC